MNGRERLRVETARRSNTVSRGVGDLTVHREAATEPPFGDGVVLRSPDGSQLIEAGGSLIDTFLACGWKVVPDRSA